MSRLRCCFQGADQKTGIATGATRGSNQAYAARPAWPDQRGPTKTIGEFEVTFKIPVILA